MSHNNSRASIKVVFFIMKILTHEWIYIVLKSQTENTTHNQSFFASINTALIFASIYCSPTCFHKHEARNFKNEEYDRQTGKPNRNKTRNNPIELHNESEQTQCSKSENTRGKPYLIQKQVGEAIHQICEPNLDKKR